MTYSSFCNTKISSIIPWSTETKVRHAFLGMQYSLNLPGYHSWRRLGDVASSLFALGYHEQVEFHVPTPAFLKDLRMAALARAYSADKNVSIFLGRPPRIHRKQCRLQIPGCVANVSEAFGKFSSERRIQRTVTDSFDCTTDTWWSALCASLKEEILDLLKEDSYDDRVQRAQSVLSYMTQEPVLMKGQDHRSRR